MEGENKVAWNKNRLEVGRSKEAKFSLIYQWKSNKSLHSSGRCESGVQSTGRSKHNYKSTFSLPSMSLGNTFKSWQNGHGKRKMEIKDISASEYLENTRKANINSIFISVFQFLSAKFDGTFSENWRRWNKNTFI